MVLGHQQVQCSQQNHTYFLCYEVPLVTTNASSTKTKYKINHKWMELNLVLRPGQNGPYFSEDIFQHIFANENVWISIKISLKFVPKGQINNFSALVQIMAWRRPGDKPLSEPMTEFTNAYMHHFSNTFSRMKMYEFQLRFHWSLFLRVKLTIFQHWFRLWLGDVQATSHYLNQWLSLPTHICITQPQWVKRRL